MRHTPLEVKHSTHFKTTDNIVETLKRFKVLDKNWTCKVNESAYIVQLAFRELDLKKINVSHQAEINVDKINGISVTELSRY